MRWVSRYFQMYFPIMSENTYFRKKQSYIFENEILNNENDNTTSEIEDVFTSLPNYYTLKFQPLIESDKHVLESIESSLEHRRSSNILQSCEFFTNVLLHDFPGEIFLQRPKIIYVSLII